LEVGALLMSLWYRENKGRLLFRVRLQPRSSANRVHGLHGDAVKISLTAPPVEGAANKMCREFLARLLGLSKSQVEQVGGFKSRLKTFAIPEMDPVLLRQKLGV